MRTGLISYDFHPPIGGQGVEAYGLYKALGNRTGVDVVVFSSRENDIRDHVRVPAGGTLGMSQLYFSLKVNMRISRVTRRNKLDLLQVYGGPGGVLLLKKPAAPLVYVANHTYAQQYRHLGRLVYRPLKMLEGIGYGRAREIVAISTTTRESLISDYGIDPEAVTVIPVGIDTSVFKPSGASQEPQSLLFVGRLCRRKGLSYLVEAIGIVRREVPDVRLYIVGEGGLRGELEKSVDETNLSSNIRFVGKVSDKELVEWYNRVEGFVLPSLFEGFGIVCLESLACGTPVIATRVPGVTDIVNDVPPCVLVPPCDATALARAITVFLKEGWGRGRKRETLAGPGFDWESISGRFVEVYKRALS